MVGILGAVLGIAGVALRSSGEGAPNLAGRGLVQLVVDPVCVEDM